MPTNARMSNGRTIRTYAPGERKPGQRSAPSSPAVPAASSRDGAPLAGLYAATGAGAAVTRALGTDPAETRKRETFVRALRGQTLSAAERRDVTEAANGFAAPDSFVDSFLLDTQYASVLFAHGLLVHTATGSAMPNFPIAVADTTVSAGTLAEGVTITETDPVLATVNFPQAPQWIADDLIVISRALVQDTGIDLAGMLTRVFGERIARATDKAWVPNLFAAAPAGNTITTAASGLLDYQSVVDAVWALDDAYRQSPHCVWLAAPGTMSTLSKLVDSAGHPVMLPRKRDVDTANQDDPATLVPNLLGFPVYTSRNAPALAAGATCLALTDLSRSFAVRIVDGGLSIQVLQERYVDQASFAYVGWARLDGQVAVTNAISAVTIHV